MTEPTNTENAPAPITREAVAAYNRQRIEEFNRRLSALCNELECDLLAEPAFDNGRIVAQILVRVR